MKIGIPTEIKAAETRVSLIPTDCKKLVQQNLEVWVQQGAGAEAGFDDAQYIQAGCKVAKNAAELYEKAELIVKVKEPLKGDLTHLRDHHTLFGYLHLASAPELVEQLKEIGLTAIAFETVVENGKTPLLAPMSAIAGRLSIQLATRFLHAPQGGRGTLLGGVEGVDCGHVAVVGAGVAGTEAMKLALGIGAKVTVVDINEQNLIHLKEKYPEVNVLLSTPENLADLLPTCDVLIGAVYVVGHKAPCIITKELIQKLPKKSVCVDISIDQGGCIETSKPCTHDQPHYVSYGVIHSAITNLPAAAPRTASQALSCSIVEYVAKLAQEQPTNNLERAVNITKGELLIDL